MRNTDERKEIECMGNTRLTASLYESRQSGIFKGVIFMKKV